MGGREGPPHCPRASREPPAAFSDHRVRSQWDSLPWAPLSLWVHPDPGRALSSLGPAESVWSCHQHSPTHQEVPWESSGAFSLCLPGFPVQETLEVPSWPVKMLSTTQTVGAPSSSLLSAPKMARLSVSQVVKAISDILCIPVLENCTQVCFLFVCLFLNQFSNIDLIS